MKRSGLLAALCSLLVSAGLCIAPARGQDGPELPGISARSSEAFEAAPAPPEIVSDQPRHEEPAPQAAPSYTPEHVDVQDARTNDRPPAQKSLRSKAPALDAWNRARANSQQQPSTQQNQSSPSGNRWQAPQKPQAKSNATADPSAARRQQVQLQQQLRQQQLRQQQQLKQRQLKQQQPPQQAEQPRSPWERQAIQRRQAAQRKTGDDGSANATQQKSAWQLPKPLYRSKQPTGNQKSGGPNNAGPTNPQARANYPR